MRNRHQLWPKHLIAASTQALERPWPSVLLLRGHISHKNEAGETTPKFCHGYMLSPDWEGP